MTKIALLMTGSELMAGDILDTNAPFLAQQLKAVGFHIHEKVSVGDSLEQLQTSISRLSAANNVLIINGGLGPTSDDLTAEVLAHSAKQPLITHAKALHHLNQWCSARQFEMSDSQLKQCQLPQTATIFEGSPGSACGFYLTVGTCLVIATPGVPSELKAITTQSILPLLQQRFNTHEFQPWQRFQVFGIGETSIQALIDEQAPTLSQYYEIGYRAQLTQVELKLKRLQTPHTLTDDEYKAQQEKANAQKQRCLNAVSPYIFAEGESSLAVALSKVLKNQSLSLGVAESCTGGLMAKEITSLAGASQCFNGGIVSYSNAVKTSVLGVSQETLNTYGAVSEHTAREMLQGCFTTLACDVAISVTGIAGPSGGSSDKPVGSVYIAYGSRQEQHCLSLCIPFERSAFQQLVCSIGFDCLRRFMLKLPNNTGFTERYQLGKRSTD